MKTVKGTLYEIRVDQDYHSIFETVDVVDDDDVTSEDSQSDYFNVVMIDVSGSMSCYWGLILENWNAYLAPALRGNTKIFVFGDKVHFRRWGNVLEEEDFLSQCTNLTAAIATINAEIQSCKDSFVRLFLVTDGAHNEGTEEPPVEIAKLSIPAGKTVEVYLLGLGSCFPVEYSIDIRSLLHNGNSNVPSLFWMVDQSCDPEGRASEMEEQFRSIAEVMKQGSMKLSIAPAGAMAPGFPSVNDVHLGEFVYFPVGREELASALSLSAEEKLNLDLSEKEINIRFLFDKVFPQWNSVIIQAHRRGQPVPPRAFQVMEAIYEKFRAQIMDEVERIADKKSLLYRLKKKDARFVEVEFATLMNRSKAIIGLEGQYSSELELAQSILKTTVKSKYDAKTLKLKGQTLDDFSEDMKKFTEVYERIKGAILALPEPSPDDCCRVTMQSMLKDLQDPTLPQLLQEDKFSFIKTFTVTGLPIFAPIKDSSQINVWTLCVQSILNSPFTIVSHNTLEWSAEVGTASASENKETFLLQGDESTRFNAVVPVFKSDEAAVLKPLIRTNIFAMLATFCVLKNPHIIDHDAHIAALACTWLKLISLSPVSDRAEFEVERISWIEATARLYLDRPAVAKYVRVLLAEPCEALMTESSKEYEGKTVKCEALVKPLFLLYLCRHESDVADKLVPILRQILLEFIGRCVAGYQYSSADSAYSHFFAPQLSTSKKRKTAIEGKVEETSKQVLNLFIQEKGELLKSFFIIENLRKSVNVFCREQFKLGEKSLFEIELNFDVLHRLTNRGSAGDMKLGTLKTFSQEMKLPQETISDLFKKENLFVYVCHSLQNKNSKDRLTKCLPTYDEAFDLVTKKIVAETNKHFSIVARTKIMEDALTRWREEYDRIHKHFVVRPMTKDQLIEAGSRVGVCVSKQNFDQIYKYNGKTCLVRNACMVEACPHFLKPNRIFNQHLFVSRTPGYAHQLHQITHEVGSRDGSVNEVIEKLKVPYSSSNGRKAPPSPCPQVVKSLEGGIAQLMYDYKVLLREARQKSPLSCN